MKKQLSLTLLSILCSIVPPIFAAPLAPFNQWTQKNFVGKNIISFSQNGTEHQINMSSNKTASALYLEQEINIVNTPILHWSWKISNILDISDETTKKTDDFSARIYVLAATGPFPWQTQTLAYTWSNHQPTKTHWPNPYTDKVVMIAIDSGAKKHDTWQQHSRNIQQDFEKYFGKKYKTIKAIAVMSDTDNSGLQTSASYKNIFFSASTP
jgi:hypothetical protein